jgi:hypothetical protein
MVDAYQDITIPFQMSTVEFFTMVRDHLNPGGVMVVNMNMRSEEEGGINDCLIDTICSVFPSVATVTVGNNTNRELFAGMNEDLFVRFRNRVASLNQDPELKEQLLAVLRDLRVEEGGEHILTDDRAPVEILGMQALDTLISDTLEAYGGVTGLLG